MIELTRTIRFSIGPGGVLDADLPRHNTFASWPPMRWLGRYYELAIMCRGEPDAVTGYFINITDIDRVGRDKALPIIADATGTADRGGDVRIGRLMREVITVAQPDLNSSITCVTLRLAPTLSIAIKEDDMSHVLISQQYEFSSAHRLHVEQLSDDENRDVFGKCNNPSGHGHNYRLEVTVKAPILEAGRVVDVEQLDELVDRVVVNRFDHKHLNQDTTEFAHLNPSVENIAQVIYGLLESALTELRCDLDQVRVWETGKTVCTYRG